MQGQTGRENRQKGTTGTTYKAINVPKSYSDHSSCKWTQMGALGTWRGVCPSSLSQHLGLCPERFGKQCRGPPPYEQREKWCNNCWSVIPQHRLANAPPTQNSLKVTFSLLNEKQRNKKENRKPTKGGKLTQI